MGEYTQECIGYELFSLKFLMPKESKRWKIASMWEKSNQMCK